MNKQVDFPKALAWIVLSTLFITGGSYKMIHGYLNRQYAQNNTSAYYLSRILQTGPQKEALSTDYLAELIQISADRPICLGKFDPRTAQTRLLSSPVIKRAEVRVIDPDTIYIDYTVRQPVAWLYDFENTALDADGHPFPIFPFFTPKNLPEIYLGLSSISYKKQIRSQKLDIAFEILKLAPQLPFTFKRIDVTHALDPSLGKREVVATIEDSHHTHLLRLTPSDFAKQLGNYLELRTNLSPQNQIVDLRLSQIGFVKKTA